MRQGPAPPAEPQTTIRYHWDLTEKRLRALEPMLHLWPEPASKRTLLSRPSNAVVRDQAAIEARPATVCFRYSLGWRTCFHYKSSERDRIVEIPRQLARVMNGTRAAQAERFLYCNQKDAGIAKLSDKWLNQEKIPKIATGQNSAKIDVKRKL